MSEWRERLFAGQPLDAGLAEAVFDRFMDGSATEAEMAILLTALKLRGETAAEVAGGVRALRKAMVALELDVDDAVDTCGTGGGALTTFNISTAAAIVAAGGGVRIAKHGNRSFTSRCGSADVLEALGVPIQLDLEAKRRMFAQTGFVFMYAPAHHPGMRHVAPVRKALGVTTIMNILGPLASPARVRRQVIGVPDPGLLTLIGNALRELGHARALVVHGEPGLDELSPLGATRAVLLDGGELREMVIDPEDFGWRDLDPGELAGGEPEANARRIEAVLAGELSGAARAAVLLNAAATFWVSGRAADLVQGFDQATRSLESGAAREKLEQLRETGADLVA